MAMAMPTLKISSAVQQNRSNVTQRTVLKVSQMPSFSSVSTGFCSLSGASRTTSIDSNMSRSMPPVASATTLPPRIESQVSDVSNGRGCLVPQASKAPFSGHFVYQSFPDYKWTTSEVLPLGGAASPKAPMTIRDMLNKEKADERRSRQNQNRRCRRVCGC
eukprot:TRINITY_DN79716_c0_g1_i1.p1 TRINITY_DN79716_c0_g1~~TRINITY_DN79716_c0_g1_i1.p1  ORF type:complete len:161 (-),score=19.64 TRINITY_DN79716_c0_g1_i1:355-837(-)